MQQKKTNHAWHRRIATFLTTQTDKISFAWKMKLTLIAGLIMATLCIVVMQRSMNNTGAQLFHRDPIHIPLIRYDSLISVAEYHRLIGLKDKLESLQNIPGIGKQCDSVFRKYPGIMDTLDALLKLHK